MKKILLSLLLLSGVSQAAPAKPLNPITAEGLKKQIAARKGKVVVVNFWATWCTPCIKELPYLAKWQKQYASKGLAILPVSSDIMSAKGKAQSVLGSKGWTQASWIVGEDQFKFVEKFDPKLKDAFGLPRTYIYNRQGKLIKVVSQEEADSLGKHILAALKK